jgi:[ribosomal protein S18]-alanine N-acetyltransferase
MIIRKAELVDVPRLVDLSGEAHTASQWNAQQFVRLIHASEKLCLVTDEDQVAYGFAIASAIAGEMEIENIVVSPQRRLRGWGRALLERLIEHAREKDVKKIFLEVRESNLPAIMLYRSLGFTESGRRKDYYSNPTEDALMLACQL